MIVSVTPSALTLFPVQPATGPYPSFYLAGINPNTGEVDHYTDPDEWSLDRDQEEQAVQLFRSPAAFPIDRGNVVFRLSFSVVRNFPSLTASETFDAMHLASCPTSGLVTIQLDADAGQFTQLYLYSTDGQGNTIGATVRVKARPFVGTTVIHDYVIRCGQIATTLPN